MRVVLDTDVMVAALRSDRGSSRRLLAQVLDGKLQMLVSVPLMIEYEAVLTRSEHMAVMGLETAQVTRMLDDLAEIAVRVHLYFHWRPKLMDPADEMVLETAVNGSADRLITFNVRHLAEAAREFGIRTVRPPEAWREIGGRHEKK